MMRLWISIGILASVACGGAPRQRVPLTDHLRSYNEAVRWQKYDKAALNVPVLEREDFLDEREALADDLRIVDYEIKRMRFRDGRTRARVDVEYTWHLDSRGVVHKTVTRQQWQKAGEAWLITEETRVRGEEMPGIAEPEPESEPAAKTEEAQEVTQNAGPDREITE